MQGRTKNTTNELYGIMNATALPFYNHTFLDNELQFYSFTVTNFYIMNSTALPYTIN